MVQGVRREEGSGWGTRVYLWRIHVDIWQNQYNIVKFKNKIKFKKIVFHSFTELTVTKQFWALHHANGVNTEQHSVN